MVKPLGKRVLIKPSNSEAKTSLGIKIPDAEQDKPMSGIIVEIGDEVENKAVTKGTKVYYPRYTGANIDVNGEKHIIVMFEDLLGFDC